MARLSFIAAIAVTLVCGPALAQSDEQGSPGAEQRIIADPDFVGGFYTDDGMSTLLPTELLAREWNRLTPDLRNEIRAECASPQDEQEDELCAALSDFE